MEEAVIANLIAKIGIQTDGKGLEDLMSKFALLKKVIKGFIVFELIHKLYELGEQFAALGEHLEASAIQTGLTTDRLQELQYAATQNAVSADELTMALSRMGRQMFQAQKGSKQAVDIFARIGITPEQIKNFKGLDEALLSVQDGIRGLGTQQEKLAVAQALYGRSGGRFLKFLQIGSAETRELMKRAQQVGAIIRHTNVKALAEFEDAGSSLKLVFRDFWANLTGAFIPTLTLTFRAIETAWGKVQGPIMRGIEWLGGELVFYAYAGLKFMGLYGELLRRVIYGGKGPGGVLHGFAVTIINAFKWVYGQLKEIFDLLAKFFAESELGQQLEGLFVDSIKLVVAWVKRLVGDLKLLYEALGAEPADEDSFFVRFLRVTIQLTSDLIRNIREIIQWYTRLIADGGFADKLAQLAFKGNGSFADLYHSFKDSFSNYSLDKGGIPPAYRAQYQGMFGGSSALQGLAQPQLGQSLQRNLVGQQRLKLSPDMAVGGGSGLSSTVNVYTQGNASPDAIASAVERKQRLVLPKLFSETRRDFESPLRW